MKLSFYCDQTFDDFEQTPKGFHCGSCNKTLVDFTRFTTKEIEVYHQQHEGVCGIYRSEHVVEHLITPIDFNGFWIKAIGASFVVFFSFLKPSFGQKVRLDSTYIEILKIEQHVDSLNKLNNLITLKVPSHYRATSLQKTNDAACSKRNELKHWKKYTRKRIYLSTRFPFIRRHNYEISGDYHYINDDQEKRRKLKRYK